MSLILLNTFGNPAAPIFDTQAFNTCAPNKSLKISDTKPEIIEANNINPHKLKGVQGSCKSDENTLCLSNNRFEITVDWIDFQSNQRIAPATKITDQSGRFGFNVTGNVEFLINIYNGESVNGFNWVYFSALSDVEYSVTITDTINNETKQYNNLQGNSSVILDNQAFGPILPAVIPLLSQWSLYILFFIIAIVGMSRIRGQYP